MTTLVVQPIETELIQEIRFNLNTRCHIAAFLPYLFLFNSPPGVFTLELESINQSAVIFSKEFNSDDIKQSLNTTNNYAHVFYPVIPSNPLQIEAGLYSLKISSSEYSSSSYLGWIQQYEDIQNVMDYIPEDDSQNPLTIRFKEHKEGIN